MGEAERWVANQKFLDRAIAKGDEFILSNPVARPGSYFEYELNYMAKQGYRLGQDGKKLITGE